MVRSHTLARRAMGCALAAALLAPSVAFSGAPLFQRADEPPLGPGPPVHAGLTVADVQAPDWDDLDAGYSFSLRIEVEVTSHLSPFVEGTLGKLAGAVAYERYDPYSQTSVIVSTDHVSQWVNSIGIGMRAHLMRRALFRPTVEAGMAARFVPVDEGYRYPAAVPSAGTKVVFADGATGFVRLGASMAQPGGAGLFADVGWEFVLRNPASRALYPIRLGILLP